MDRLYYLTVTTPPATPIATPQLTPWPLEDNQLVYVDIIVPPGPSGQLGFRILWAQQQVIPWGNNSYLVADDDKIHVDVNEAMTVTGLVIATYNTDVFAHSIYLRGLIRTITPNDLLNAQIATGTLALPAPLDTTDVSGGINTFTNGGFVPPSFEVDQGTLADSTAGDMLAGQIPVETPTGQTPIITDQSLFPNTDNGSSPNGNQAQADFLIPEPNEFDLAYTGS